MEKKNIAKEIAECIRGNEECSREILIEAAKDLNLDVDAVLKREEKAASSELVKKEGVHFVLFGEPYPSKKGYVWC